MIKVYSMTAIMDLSFPGQDSVYMYTFLTIVYTCQVHVLESLKIAFFVQCNIIL